MIYIYTLFPRCCRNVAELNGKKKKEKKKIYTLIRVMLVVKSQGEKKKEKKFVANLRYMGEECCVHISTLRQPEEKRSATNCPCYNIVYILQNPIPIPGGLASPYLQEQLGECSDPDASTSPAGHWYLREESVPPRPPKKKKKKKCQCVLPKNIYIYPAAAAAARNMCAMHSL